jgi:hypothetical protein
MKRMRATTALWAILGAAALCGACTHNSTTEPSLTSSSSTTTPAAAPTVTEAFNGTLPVGGFRFYSFTIAVNGTVNVTLTKVSGTSVPSTVQLGLGIGQPSGNDCSTTQSVTAASSTVPQTTGVFGPGVFCVRVSDVGNLFAPATFAVTIAHP